jgi:hypothetical protein
VSSCTTATRTTTSSPACYINYARPPAQGQRGAAQAYPDAIWPGQAAGALRALIHAANTARDQGLGRIPADQAATDLLLFRRGVTVGLSQVRRIPGPNEKLPPARLLLECLRHREHDVLRFLTDLRIPPTSNQADYAEFGVMRTRRWMPWHAGGPGLARPA